MRIMEILVTKEEQAYKNIRDPALLMGKFNIEEEELITAAAIENDTGAEDFSSRIDESADEFDPFELLMQGAVSEEEPPSLSNDETLYSDSDYLRSAFLYFSRDETHPVQKLQTVEGIDITVTQITACNL
jgi:hypothetical protein